LFLVNEDDIAGNVKNKGANCRYSNALKTQA
jgi:hypothetical protein